MRSEEILLTLQASYHTIRHACCLLCADNSKPCDFDSKHLPFTWNTEHIDTKSPVSWIQAYSPYMNQIRYTRPPTTTNFTTVMALEFIMKFASERSSDD
jgi:hypothetical protein